MMKMYSSDVQSAVAPYQEISTSTLATTRPELPLPLHPDERRNPDCRLTARVTPPKIAFQ